MIQSKGMMVCLVVLCFPPVRILDFGAMAGGVQDRALLRPEVDAGELVRILAFFAVFFTAAYLWLPAFIGALHREINDSKPEPPV